MALRAMQSVEPHCINNRAKDTHSLQHKPLGPTQPVLRSLESHPSNIHRACFNGPLQVKKEPMLSLSTSEPVASVLFKPLDYHSFDTKCSVKPPPRFANNVDLDLKHSLLLARGEDRHQSSQEKEHTRSTVAPNTCDESLDGYGCTAKEDRSCHANKNNMDY